MKYLVLVVGAIIKFTTADDNFTTADDSSFCYGGGATFKNTFDALIEAKDHCNFWDDIWFNPWVEELSCHNDRSRQKVVLSIWRPTETGARMDGELCNFAMEKLAYTCPRGGQSYKDGWGFR
jgi:hypothetical protein